MKPEEDQFLKAFFSAVSDRPLEPDDERYVPLYGEDLTDADPCSSLPKLSSGPLRACGCSEDDESLALRRRRNALLG